MKVFLGHAQGHSDYITPGKSKQGKVGRLVEEDFPDGCIVCSEGLQYTNHVCTFQDQDQQAGYHIKPGYNQHQDNQYNHIQILQV